MQVGQRDLGPSIPVMIPSCGGKKWTRSPVIYRGWRASKHFVLFRNTLLKDSPWTLATGHGFRSAGFASVQVALELADDLEQTDIDWTVPARLTETYKEQVGPIVKKYRHLED